MGSIFNLTALGASRAFSVPRFYRRQAAALCWRRDGDNVEVLLVSGRGNSRWGIPKGTIEAGENSSQAAAREAFEEAGVKGRCNPDPIGVFHYFKSGHLVPYEVRVHMLKVDTVTDSYPEVGQRSLDWTPLRHASGFIARQGLAKLLGEIGTQVDCHLEFGKLSLATH